MGTGGGGAEKGWRDFPKVHVPSSLPPFSCRRSRPTPHTPHLCPVLDHSPACWPAQWQGQHKFLQELDGGWCPKGIISSLSISVYSACVIEGVYTQRVRVCMCPACYLWRVWSRVYDVWTSGLSHQRGASVRYVGPSMQ